jgi:hypothetical protein
MSVVGQGAAGQDDVRGERDQFRSMFYALVGIVLAPASLDRYIPANTPAQFLEALVERRKSVSTFRVVRSAVHEDTNPPQTFRLLRARPERLDDRRAAEQRDELASFQLIEWHSIPASQDRIAGYRIGRDRSGGNGTILQLVSRWRDRPLSRDWPPKTREPRWTRVGAPTWSLRTAPLAKKTRRGGDGSYGLTAPGLNGHEREAALLQLLVSLEP